MAQYRQLSKQLQLIMSKSDKDKSVGSKKKSGMAPITFHAVGVKLRSDGAIEKAVGCMVPKGTSSTTTTHLS